MNPLSKQPVGTGLSFLQHSTKKRQFDIVLNIAQPKAEAVSQNNQMQKMHWTSQIAGMNFTFVSVSQCLSSLCERFVGE